MSGATTPVYHRYYPEADQRPAFYLDPVAQDLGRFGRADPQRFGRAAIPAPRTAPVAPMAPVPPVAMVSAARRGAAT